MASVLQGQRWWFALGLSIAAGCDSIPSPEASHGAQAPTVVGDSEHGQLLFTRDLRCDRCHGSDGRGLTTPAGGPSIVGRRIEDLRIKITTPCDEVSTLLCHPLILTDLLESDLQDLVAYLATLVGSGSEDSGPVCDDTPGRICTIAGNGVSGSLAGQLLAREQYLSFPQNVTLDPEGRVVIVDWNNYLVRRIEPNDCRVITDADGNQGEDCRIRNIVGSGIFGDSCSIPGTPVAALDANLAHLTNVVYDDLVPGQHNILLAAWHNFKIKYIPIDENGDPGTLHCLFGNDEGASVDGLPAGFKPDGTGALTQFKSPTSVALDNQGNFYIADQGSLRVRMVRADDDDRDTTAAAVVESRSNNVITTIAGGKLENGIFQRTDPSYLTLGDKGPALDATFNVDPSLGAPPQFRIALDRDRNYLYVADSENHRIRIIYLNDDPPTIDTFAGGGPNDRAEGVSPLEARLHSPFDVDVATDGSGDILITDTLNHCVRLIDFESYTIRTVAGRCGVAGYDGDGGPAVEALLSSPGGSYLGPDGTIYVADSENHRVRRVNPLPLE